MDLIFILLTHSAGIASSGSNQIAPHIKNCNKFSEQRAAKFKILALRTYN